MTKTVVILGAAFAGLHVAHYILKNSKDVKVIIVSKSSHFYWNLASVRAIVSGTFKDEQIFGSLETALSKYPKDKVELIVGAAEGFDASAKTVRVVPASGGGERTLSYDQLVLATGSRAASSDVPWKATGGYEEAVAQLGRTRERVSAAKHIVVAGAGSTGVEVSGELGFAHGKEKEVVLLCGGPALLGGDSIASNAAAELKKLNVAVRYDAKVASTSVLPDGKTEVVLESGDKILTDLYLPTMGLVPNTEYVDASLLTEKKLVAVDECFHVKGVEDVWALGDVVSIPRAGFMITQKQAAGVGKNIDLVLKGKQPVPVKGLPLDIFAVTTGRSRGVGRMGSVKMLSLMVWMAKGRNMGTNMFPPYMDGSVA